MAETINGARIEGNRTIIPFEVYSNLSESFERIKTLTRDLSRKGLKEEFRRGVQEQFRGSVKKSLDYLMKDFF
jgi:hypothetical protein